MARWSVLRGAVCAAALVAVVVAGCSGSPAEPTVSSSSNSAGPRDVAAAVEGFFAADTTDYYRNRRAVLVSVDGALVVEQYHGISPGDHVNIQSAGKSILSSLIGIAIDEGLITGVDATLGELLPTYADDMTPATRQITLDQLLTMTAGLPGDESFYSQVLDQPDWVRHILTDYQLRPPGQFAYSSAGSHLLSAILKQAAGMSPLDYARTHLFDPLGIATSPSARITVDPSNSTANIDAYDKTTDFTWPVDPQGVNIGGGGQKLTARDMLALGQMWLDDGQRQGRQIVPVDWLKQATQRHVDTHIGSNLGYGYQFWLPTAGGHPAFAALGFGGQIIEVVRDLDLVVVVQATSPSDPTAPAEPGTAQENDYLQMVDLVIAPAVG